MSTAKTDQFYSAMTARILDMMETHGTDWTKPWTATAAAGMPHNACTNYAYRGGNVLWLMLTAMDKGYTSNQWATFNQWSEALGNKGKTKKDQVQVVRKGEKSTQVLYASKIMVDDKENPGEKKQIFMMKTYNVFNIAQLENVPAKFTANQPEPIVFERNDTDEWIDAIGADIRHGGDRAYFAPVQDYIQVPNREDFHTDAAFYATTFHELVHWTGHETRLNRPSLTAPNSDRVAYATDELVAELGAAFLSVSHGLTVEPRADHARYLNNWITALKNDTKAIYRCAAAAVDAIAHLDELAGVNQDDTTGKVLVAA